jgi:hypothetical protein
LHKSHTVQCNRRAAAATAGAAASSRDAQKRARRYRDRELTGYSFVPLSTETHGCLGKPFTTLVSDLGDLAVDRGEGAFTKGQFNSGVLREIIVTLCRFNARLEEGVSSFFVKASGHCLRHGRTHPTAEEEDLVVRYPSVSDVQNCFCSVECNDFVTLRDVA